MRLATLRLDGRETAALRSAEFYLPIFQINARIGADFPEEMMALLESGRMEELRRWNDTRERRDLAQRKGFGIGAREASLAPLYRRPGKIWGIGLNYSAHAADLSETAPTAAPASFMKPFTAVIGPGDSIRIPYQSERTTAEAELAVVIGRVCRDIPPDNWLEAVAGFCSVIDMTAEDILRQNPRYLTLSKSFDTFFSFGPELVTPDEIADVKALEVSTVLNGKVCASNTVAHMTFTPDRLVSFHSHVMTLLAGDVISTGTPGAVPIRHGDRVECRIHGFAPLTNPVLDQKRSS